MTLKRLRIFISGEIFFLLFYFLNNVQCISVASYHLVLLLDYILSHTVLYLWKSYFYVQNIGLGDACIIFHPIFFRWAYLSVKQTSLWQFGWVYVSMFGYKIVKRKIVRTISLRCVLTILFQLFLKLWNFYLIR